MKTHVKLRHPKTGGEWLCPAGAVEAWLAKGWKKADAATANAKTTGKDK
ncbi:hypothetical protein [Glycomyces tarimensis]